MATQLGSTGTAEFVLGLPHDTDTKADRYSIRRAAHAFIAAVREELRARKAMAQLEALNDHLLKDIGLARRGIASVARATIDARRL